MTLVATVLEDAIVLLSEENDFNKFENRLSEYSVYENFKNNAPRLLPKSVIERIKSSDRQPVKVPVLNQGTNPLITTRSCTVTVPGKDSAFYTLTWSTFGFAAGITPAVHADNYISAEQSIASQIKDGIRTTFAALDSAAVTAIDAGTTTTFSSSLYANAGGAYQVPQADKEEFYRNIPAIMKRHDLNASVYDDVANTEALILERFLNNQGMANGTNEQYVFQNTNYNFYRSNRVTNGAGVEETHYISPVASTGVYEWIDIDSRNNHRVNEGKGWTVMTDPIIGEQWGVYFTRDCSDESAVLSGLEATLTEAWMWTKDYAFVTARNSASDTSIVKFEILA